ncbi:hypothetical protein BU25DRAFT_381962 [Macroventuria anomochaeta]|uniref:Uncharacterized protein n=1 Tax=Macroventuria anomochaeta TaxID=301207 RepID=A0ACB6SEN6_9PLEO|nr:uncharacterized protein BU25DRAFT_381962 [Macroventuria anomochaeta]KAF2632494.1 hypothetical protein BU25DRAFT_381962 [Macroventuria anomochaeta]
MVLVDVLKLPSSTGQWSSEQVELEYLTGEAHQLSCYIFLTRTAYPQREAERKQLLRCFNVPRMVYMDMGYRCNGYFGSRESHDKAGRLEGYFTWFRCLVKIARSTPQAGTGYTWSEMTFFSRWESGHCMMLCVDTPDGFQEQLEQIMESEQGALDLNDPFALHMPLMDQIITSYDQSVWNIRDLIRRVEKERENDWAIDADFSELHEISRHATHSTETLSVTTESMKAMRERHKDFHERSHSTTIANNACWTMTQQRMDFQAQLIRNLKLRSRANQERLQSEITLAYNVITQRDSKVMVEIGAATKSDSAAMKTVAIVTMIFLPATFTSAVFSMSFFDFSPGDGTQADEWRVSSKIWIYWVVAISLTGLTLFAWLFWRRKRGQMFAIGRFRERRAHRLQGMQREKA